uniref:Myosin XVIIIB n=1 Tax=Anser cygnoides TaxID=8845 RepID=A0A8B9DSW1_ANSCY
MAISSRLALWEQKGSIREEDRAPPPSAPPLLLSVIPGGFIKQLVRETEKESKEARLKKKAKATVKEDVSTERIMPCPACPPCSTRVAAKPPSCPEKSPKDAHPGGSPPAPAPAPSKGPQSCSKGPVKEGDALKGKGPEGSKKEKGAPEGSKKGAPEGSKKGAPAIREGPAAKGRTRRELVLAKKEPEKMRKDAGGGKKELREIKEPGKTTNKSEGPKGEPGGIQGKPEDVAKEAGKAKEKSGKSKEAPERSKEAPGESKEASTESKEETADSADQDQAGSVSVDGDAVFPAQFPARSCTFPLSPPRRLRGTFGTRRRRSGSSSRTASRSVTRRALPSPSCGQLQGDFGVWPWDGSRVAPWQPQHPRLCPVLPGQGPRAHARLVAATQLKPDVGTPELPAGRVRVRLEADGSVVEADEDSVQRSNPPGLDLAEDLAALVSLNECSALNTLRHRLGAQLPYTYAGPSLLALGGGPNGRRDGGAPHPCSMAQRAYRTLLTRRQDQAIVALGRSGAGRTACCQGALEYLVGTAGGVDGTVSVEKIQAMFTVLGAFGSVTTGHSSSSTRFSMVLSLDFSAAGRITAAHLQTMLLERGRVARQPPGESNFNVFPLMLAGLDAAQRTTLHLHQVAESNSFGIKPFSKPEEKQRASAAFAQLQAAMGVLGITAEEQAAVWHVLAGIYHLGAAGACKVGRKQFMKFEWANRAADVLGCELEELTTAVFKHHLKQIIAQATARGGRLPPEEESPSGPKMTGMECVEGMAAGLYEELFAALVSLINRSFSSQHLSMGSIAVVDTPGFHNPRHHGGERAATFEELCHNYVHERLQALFYEKTFVSEMERYKEVSARAAAVEQPPSPWARLPAPRRGVTVSLQVLPGSLGADRRGLLWILDEEVLVPGSGDSAAFDRLCSYFAPKGPGYVRKCEQELHFEIPHQLGTDPVRYDLAGWVSKAKLNLSAENASQLLQQSRLAVQELVLPRRRAPRGCRAVAGLEGCSQAALQRSACIRKTFASSLAAVRKRSVCAQLKLQADALTSLLRRSQLHFIHCLVPGAAVEGGDPAALDMPSLRAQLGGTQLLDALRLRRTGTPWEMPGNGLQHRRPQARLSPLTHGWVPCCGTGCLRAIEELFQALDLEKKSVAIGRSQVFLKAGVMPRLEKQRDKLITQKIILLQAACKGFLSRQKFKRLKVQRLAVRCIHKNLVLFQAVRHWPWWQLLSRVRPLLSVSLAEEQLRAKEEELAALRRKLEKSEQSCSELRQNTEKLESKIIDLTMELSDERHKGDVACQVLDGERAERLRGARELQELQSKHDQVQKKLESVQKQLEEAQQLVQLREMKISGCEGEDAWHVRFDCAQTEIAFLQKRLAQLEERLGAELSARTGLEQKLGEAQAACGAARAAAQQLQRRCRRLACELEDARALAESQQSRNHELEKRQKKFDLQLAQALGESAFERSLREKVTQENSSLRWEMGKLQQSLEQKQAEGASLEQRAAQLAGRLQELSAPGAPDARAVPALRQQLWDLEASAAEQQKELERQTAAVDHLEQLHQRLELEIERMKQIHQKELEDKDEELEDVRQSCQRRLRQLEMQLEQEYEEKQTVLHEKQDLEGLVGTLCEQIGHRDLDVEKRLRRDLRRTRALLADAQLLLAAPTEPGAASAAELERLHRQLEESEARCAEAQRSQQATALQLENLHAELETLSRNKTLADEQLSQLQHERADLLRRVDEDQEDLNELMAKHKALIAQSATDIAQIQELQTQVEDAKKEKQSLQEKLRAAQASAARLEQRPAERAVISRQEAHIRDLESRLDCQAVQMKRFEVLVLRLRDSIIKMGEELEKAAESEAREKEITKYYQRRMEEMKADMNELVQRELESSRRRVELVRGSQGLPSLAALGWGLRETRAMHTSVCCWRASGVLPSLLPWEVRALWNPLLGARRREYGKTPADEEELAGPKQPVDKAGTRSPLVPRWGFSPALERRTPSPASPPVLRSVRSPLPSASAALSDYVGELRRRRGAEREQGPLQLEDASALPIYRTTGAAALRRCRLQPEVAEAPGNLSTDQPGASGGAGSSLLRSSSLRSMAWEPAETGEPARSPVLKRASKFGSCDSLLLSLGSSGRGLSSAAVGMEALGAPRLRPWRSCLEPSAEEGGEAAGWASLGCRSARSSPGLGEGQGGDPSGWKMPTLSFERRTGPDLDDFLPAIRKSRSTSSLAKPGRDRRDGHRPLTVRFEDEAITGGSASSRSRSMVQPGLAPGGDAGTLSDSSSSSGSVRSSRSADSIKRRPRRPDGEGCSGKGTAESSVESLRAEAEGKEDDVSSIMRKYLGKE